MEVGEGWYFGLENYAFSSPKYQPLSTLNNPHKPLESPYRTFHSMKKLHLLILFLGFVFVASAQQEQMYTQFMFNKLAYNPGYAGSFVSPTLTAIYRNQWMGLEGSPKVMALSYTQPLLNNRVGIGGNIIRQSIGINTNLTVDIACGDRSK